MQIDFSMYYWFIFGLIFPLYQQKPFCILSFPIQSCIQYSGWPYKMINCKQFFFYKTPWLKVHQHYYWKTNDEYGYILIKEWRTKFHRNRKKSIKLCVTNLKVLENKKIIFWQLKQQLPLAFCILYKVEEQLKTKIWMYKLRESYDNFTNKFFWKHDFSFFWQVFRNCLFLWMYFR